MSRDNDKEDEIRKALSESRVQFSEDDVVTREEVVSTALIDLIEVALKDIQIGFVSDNTQLGLFMMNDKDISAFQSAAREAFEWFEDVDTEWMLDKPLAEVVLGIRFRSPRWPRPENIH